VVVRVEARALSALGVGVLSKLAEGCSTCRAD